MTKLYVEPAFQVQLGVATEAVELCDQSGQVLGYYCPLPRNRSAAELQSPLTDEELQRRLQEPGGRPLKDILRDLGAE